MMEWLILTRSTHRVLAHTTICDLRFPNSSKFRSHRRFEANGLKSKPSVLIDHITERINSEWEELLNLLNAIFSFHMSQLNNVHSITPLNRNNIPRARKERRVPLGDQLDCTNKTMSKNKHKNYQRNSGYKQVAHVRLMHVHTTCWMQSRNRASLGFSCSSFCSSATAAANVMPLHPSSFKAQPELLLLQFSLKASRKLFAILLIRSCQVHFNILVPYLHQ